MTRSNYVADRRYWSKWLALIIPLLPLAAGQGWIGEVVFVLVVFVNSTGGLGYFFPFFMDYTRTLVPLPFAVALLTPWPEWTIAAMLVACWLATAGITAAIAGRIFPQRATAATIAFFLVGVTAYDTSLLHAQYVQLLMASTFHWAGLLLLLLYCERVSLAYLLGSTLLQVMSVATYATALPAVALGPLVATAFISSRTGIRSAIRPAVAVAVAWWSIVLVYLLALIWVAGQHGSYVAAGGGLSLRPDYPSLVVALMTENFNPIAWLDPVNRFGDPTRLISAHAVWAIALVSAACMIPALLAAWRSDVVSPAPPITKSLIASLLAVVVACNMATAVLQDAGMNFRTHLISRLYAALVISAIASVLLRSAPRGIRFATAVLIMALLVCGAWTVADRATYLTSIWPRHRAELRSLDEAVRHIAPRAGIVLYVPPGSGYTATVAPWHALPWLMLIRGGRLAAGRFALWSPDRGAVCEVRNQRLHCEGDQQKPVEIPLGELVVLEYDRLDCRYKIVEGGETPAALAHTAYRPAQLMTTDAPPKSRIFDQLLYGPQGFARSMECG